MDQKPISVSGIKPTGLPHLGNFIGMIRPALSLASQYDSYYFIADFHALNSVHDPGLIRKYTRSVAATYIACGLDPDHVTFYRQSDVPETFELATILAAVTPKGLLNRAHAYKAARDQNRSLGNADLDTGVNMGLYNYPVLMAADILLMGADTVPVGKDQVQHVEYTRDIAEKFNSLYGATYSFPLPVHLTPDEATANAMPGLDGRKMSKSYGNTIPLFSDEAELRNLIRSIKTDSAPVEAPRDPEASTLFAIYRQFASVADQAAVSERLVSGGLGGSELKEILFDELNNKLAKPRATYRELMADPMRLDALLAAGARKARQRALPLMTSVRKAVGIDE
jgi:tryptophanyl-tRNA synthetase